MKYLDLNLATPEANLACDEALLDACEERAQAEVLRFWESTTPFVVVGYANQTAREVHMTVCYDRKIPVLRRCTGGGAVVQGPGCLNFSLCLRMEGGGPLEGISESNCFIMEKQRQAFETLLQSPVKIRGHTDLTISDRKFSGNAQRRKRRHLLFHGSVLLDFHLPQIQELLPAPSKQPDYRANRSHLEFLRNLGRPASEAKAALRDVWNAHEPLNAVPSEAIANLVREKYSRDDWNLRF